MEEVGKDFAGGEEAGGGGAGALFFGPYAFGAGSHNMFVGAGGDRQRRHANL